MKSQRYNWNQFWSEKAKENFIKSTGRSDENIFEIFFYVYSLCKILKLNKNDIILDAGGGNGMVAFLLSRFVKKIYTFDNSKSLIIGRTKILGSNFLRVSSKALSRSLCPEEKATDFLLSLRLI